MAAVEKLEGGRNSRVFRVDLGPARSVVVKAYARLDRLRIEFSTLEFLWSHGVRIIPEPLSANPDMGCAVYQFIAGERIHPSEVSNGDIDAAVSFLGALRDLGQSPDAQALPLASEACWTLGEIFHSIEQRLDRFAGLLGKGEPWRQLRCFFAEDFLPELAAVRQWSEECGGALWNNPISVDRKTLSPSDFGFHNAIRQPDGALVFLDFEHFGWDDPAKMAADFLLHPHESMAFGYNLKQRFLAQLLTRLDSSRSWLEERIRLVMPLYSLKWSVILLNEFVPTHLARRRFAGNGNHGEELLLAQLQKARAMLRCSQEARTRACQDN
ncbi:MAG: hypothetical protein HYZ52_02825 [Candidatus Omnitrophica bacterium]|nr:hypothetical protein [Candidatus Omnitrophota bacterium]